MRFLVLPLLSLLLAPSALASDPAVRAALKEVLNLSDAELEEAERRPVVKEVLSEGGEREVTTVGITHIDAPVSAVLAQLRQPELLLDASFLQQLGRFSQPPKPGDVASYRIPESDVRSLRDCRVGACKVKLQAFRIEEFQSLDWSAPDVADEVEAVARRAIVEYATGYLARGEPALAQYADHDPPQSLAEGFARLLGRARYVEEHMPALERHLLEFPAHRDPAYEDELYWAVADFGYRPVTELIHAVTFEPDGAELPGAVIALKHIFATHYFHARLELVGLVEHADHPGATDLVYVDRSLFDSDLGSLKRGMLVRGVLRSKRERLASLRARIEKGAGRTRPASTGGR